MLVRSVRTRVPVSFPLLFLGMMIPLLVPGLSSATETESDASTFRWIHSASDPQIWEQILTSFNDELVPDEAQQGQSELDVYRYKYLQKVGVVNHSALVIVGHRPAKEVSKANEWDEYSSAFNFDLVTSKKSSIEHAGGLWKWKFIKLAKFGPSSIPDVTFNYLALDENS